ncbi:MAG: sensor histidine kinase [Methanomassiliicoccales archaeon]
MRLRNQVLLQYAVVGIIVLLLVGIVSTPIMQDKELDSVEKESISQLEHIDFAITYMIEESKADIVQLALDDRVQYRDDSNFTNFVNVTGDGFVYNITPEEQAIIDVLKDFQDSHPYVNSCYMGRENGAFVRAYPRAQPTQYDPRERPWYQMAVENPGEVQVTDPYLAVTTDDVNIGIVLTLIDNGTVYGVVGADITLVGLTTYLGEASEVSGREMLLADDRGIVLASRDQGLHFANVSQVLGDQTEVFLDSDQGMIHLENDYFIYYTSTELGWKIVTFIPESYIAAETTESMVTSLGFISLAIVLLAAITILSIHYTVIRPIGRLTDTSRKIAETGVLDFDIKSSSEGEIGTLTSSVGSMVHRINEEAQGRERTLAELERYRDHLEELVQLRTKDLEIAKERAESADRLKSAFLATMSHELRTPLNSIIGFSGILLQELAGPINEEQKKQLGMVQASSEHLLALINDVLDLSKIEAGQLTLYKTPFDPQTSMDKVLGTVRPLLERKGLHLRTILDLGGAKVVGDSRRFEQVLLNLLSNAIKFTDAGGITVEAKLKGGKAVIKVADSGIGIKKSDMDRLFKPFSQLDSGLTRQYEGTGLGLSISERLIRLMDGDISVRSEYGKGTEFTITLPISDGDN